MEPVRRLAEPSPPSPALERCVRRCTTCCGFRAPTWTR